MVCRMEGGLPRGQGTVMRVRTVGVGMEMRALRRGWTSKMKTAMILWPKGQGTNGRMGPEGMR